jgi:hypothetical protein
MSNSTDEPDTKVAGVLRTFDGGATRDSSTGKLSYYNCMSPMVLERFMEYMEKHRVQPDGQLRAWDNWKSGIPKEVYDDSLVRHIFDYWKFVKGEPYEPKSDRDPVDVEEFLCSIMFNAMGRLYEELKGKQ